MKKVSIKRFIAVALSILMLVGSVNMDAFSLMASAAENTTAEEVSEDAQAPTEITEESQAESEYEEPVEGTSEGLTSEVISEEATDEISEEDSQEESSDATEETSDTVSEPEEDIPSEETESETADVILPEEEITKDVSTSELERMFPDPVFRQYVLDNCADDAGNVQMTLIANATEITISSALLEDLTGLSYFTNLEELNCNNTGITKLDVSENKLLEELKCENCAIKELDLSKNTALKKLYINGNNAIEKLELKNTLLERVFCKNCANLESINVSGCTALKELNCSKNSGTKKLTSLDLTKNTKLEILDYSGNEISTLDISKNVLLSSLTCNNNGIAKLDISKNTALTYIDCKSNELTSLDVSKNTKLLTLHVENNKLYGMDITKNLQLNEFYCSNNCMAYLNSLPAYAYAEGFMANNIYYAESSTINLSKNLPGFDYKQIKKDTLKNAKLDANNANLIVEDASKPVTYQYYINNSKFMDFTISVELPTVPVERIEIVGEQNVILEQDEIYDISAKILPADATVQGYTISIPNSFADNLVKKGDTSVQALKASATPITVTVTALGDENKTTTVNITVVKAKETIGSIMVYSGSFSKLGNISLENGSYKDYEWVYPDTTLESYKDCIVPFDVKKNGIKAGQIAVYFNTYTQVRTMIYSDCVAGATEPTIISALPVSSFDMDKYDGNEEDIYYCFGEVKAKEITSFNLGFTFDRDDGIFFVDTRNVTKTGNAKFRISVPIRKVENDSLYTTIYQDVTIKVIPNQTGVTIATYADNTYTDIGENSFNKGDEGYLCAYAGTTQTTADNTFKLVSANNKIIKLGKPTTDSATKMMMYPYEVLDYGKVTFNATSTTKINNAIAKKSQSVIIVDPTPIVQEKEITLDKCIARSATVTINEIKKQGESGYYNSFSNIAISDIKPSNGNFTGESFVISDKKSLIGKHELTIDFYNGMDMTNVKKGTYTLTFVNPDTDAFIGTVKLKITETKPVVKMKQTQKVELFYVPESSDKKMMTPDTDTYTGLVEITSTNGSITNFDMEDCDFNCEQITETNKYNLNIKADAFTEKGKNQLDKSATYVASFDGYRKGYTEVRGKCSIATSTAKPKVEVIAQNSVLYTSYGMTSTKLFIKINQKESTTASIVQDTFASTPTGVFKIDNDVVSFVDKNNMKSGSVKVSVTDTDFSSPISVTVKIKAEKKLPVVAMKNSTITLNQKYKDSDLAYTDIYIKDASGFSVKRVTIEAANDATKRLSNKVKVYYDATEKQMKAQFITDRVSWKPEDYNGNYSYKLTSVIEHEVDGKKVVYTSNSLNLKLTLINKDVTVKASGKGTIDILRRSETGIVYTTKTSNINGTVCYAKLTGANKNLFSVTVDDNQAITLRAVDNGKYRTDISYKVEMEYYVKTKLGQIKVVSKPLNVKLKQSNAKYSALNTLNASLHSSNGLTEIGAVQVIGTPIGIGEDDTISLRDPSGMFFMAIEGTKPVIHVLNRINLVPGKTYTVYLQIKSDQAAVNSKPVEVPVKITVVK